MILSVRTGTSPAVSPFGSPINLDFSDDIPEGQRIVAFAAGISGFCCNYETDSALWAERMGTLNVSLGTYISNSTVRVISNIAMTDYGGSVGRAVPDGDTDPACQAQVTALALIDTGEKGTEGILSNLYGVNDSPGVSVYVGTNDVHASFLSGFRVAGSGGDTGSAGGLKVSTSATPSGETASVIASTSTAGFTTDTSTDVLFLSTANTVSGFAIEQAQITWQDADGENGKTGSLSFTFTIPSGYSKIAYCASLLQTLDIVYSKTANFQMIKAWVSSLEPGAVSSNNGTLTCTVTGSINLNMYDPDFTSHCWIDDSSSADVYIAVQYGN